MIHPGTRGDTAVVPLSSRSGHRKKKDPTSVGAVSYTHLTLPTKRIV